MNASLKSIIISLSLVIVLLCGLYYIWYRDVSRSGTHASELEYQIANQSQTAAYMDTLEATLRTSSDDIAAVNGSVVTSDGNVAFIESLESMAHDQHLTFGIDALNIEEDPALTQYGMVFLKIKAKAEGSWADLYRYLLAVEGLPVKVRVDNVALLKSDDKDEKAPPWRLSFEIRVMKYK